MKDKICSKNNYGYTLLFSIIVASVVLSIAAFILQVSRKQIVLSTVNRDSILAIYAADSAIQCMVQAYYSGLLATSTSDGNPSGPQVNCAGIQDINKIYSNTNTPMSSEYNFKVDGNYKISYLDTPLNFSFYNDTCALVYLYDGYDNTTSKHKTIIEVRGYNNQFSKPCNTNNDATYNPRTVERAIRLVYTD